MTRRTTQRDLAREWRLLTGDPWLMVFALFLLTYSAWVVIEWRDCRRRGGVPIPVWLFVECAAKASK